MGGMDDYLAYIKQSIFIKVYEKHYHKLLSDVTNVVAMRKRKELEQKLTAKLHFSLKMRIEKKEAKERIEKKTTEACKEAVVLREKEWKRVVKEAKKQKEENDREN
jgi:hypothetical protein